ncbi:ATP-binding protein [Phenylobacterium sp. J426]|uniref:ATP-binding protein n=1 Tax=Phenylobacterium sp. J426 TaxID=2898439 RepID=UPI002151EEC9|nr:ATP-binding protein [Phenylobacterium sp. J426]MCR5876328.1 ATP-binding protein [Phenylobacterium sp. J426]
MNDVTTDPTIDLDACAAEPIRIPGGIQPHGALMVVDPVTLEVLQASSNLPDVTGLVGGLPEALAAELRDWAASDSPAFMRTMAVGARNLQVSAHRTAQGLIVEFEEPPASGVEARDMLYLRLRQFLEAVGEVDDIPAIAAIAVREVRALTGFDRVLLYSFDAEGVGTVLAENGNEVLPSYLNLRFPAADIPAQARELYKLSRLRLIPDANYEPAPIEPPLSPLDGRPLDLSFAALRSVSPVHLEYMRNMGTGSSMSISILVEGELWGLISGHSRDPRRVDAQVRTACDVLGQILSLQIEAREQAVRTADRLALKNVEAELVAKLSTALNYQTGLGDNAELWKQLARAEGAAVVTEEGVLSVGSAPPEDQIRRIAERLSEMDVTELAIESMAQRWPETEAFAERASGLLAVSISQIHSNWLMWFRPEVIRTVEWAGEPQKQRELGDRLHPRKSFQLWKEQVRLRATPWGQVDVESARSFRSSIQNFVLRRAEERAELTNRLVEINKELESFSYSISHDLRAPFRHVVGFAELLNDRAGERLDPTSRHYLQSITDAALSAGQLVDDLLNFSQLGRAGLKFSRVDVSKLVAEVRRSMEPELEGREIEWRVGALPSAWADPAMIRQVLQNLLHNALKYSAGRNPAIVTIEGEDLSDSTSYTVSDNGVGFDPAYAHKLFGVFQRLHRSEEFEGTGIGLALVKRVIDRHGGTITAHGVVDGGASFTFTLPKRLRAEHPE